METVTTRSFTLAVRAEGGQDSNRLALVLPGRLDSKDYAHMRSHVELLAAHGFYALSFDPPGTWGSGDDISLFTTTNYLQAIAELIELTGRRPTLLVGHSRGGAVAALAASASPVIGVVAAMASYGAASAPSPVASHLGYELSSRDLPQGGPADDADSPQREFRLPLAYFADSQRYDAASALRALAKPKLLVYGADDSFTPPERVEELYEELPEPKQLVRLDCGHDYRFDVHLIDAVNAAIGSFLDRLPTDAAD